MRNSTKFISLLLLVVLASSSLMAQDYNLSQNESVENNILTSQIPHSQSATNDQSRSWNMQFNYPINSNFTGQAGIESDGTFFYVTQWNNTSILRYDSVGNYINSFTISGVSNLRDLAYDGTYFYGSDVTNKIYEMDFTNETLISTIMAPTGTLIRHIAYDEINDAFWVGNWATDIDLIDRTGALINSISAATHGLASTYGTAWDNYTPGGPYLWAINATGDDVTFRMLDLATGAPTGLEHNILEDMGLVEGSGGGLFIQQDVVEGTITLGGLLQNVSIFGYDLLNLMDSIDGAVIAVNSPNSGSGLSATESISIEIANYGTNMLTSAELSYVINGGDTVTENYTGALNYGETDAFTFAQTADFSANGTYELEVFIDLVDDGDDTNDSFTKVIYSLANSSERLVLIEHFTQASCAPCASQNPALDALINQANNVDRVVHIAYHTSWPGTDPMYNFNNTNGLGDARVDYYNVGGVPDCVIAGNKGQGLPSIVDQNAIDTEYLRPGFFEITGTAIATVPYNTLSIDLAIKSHASFPLGTIKAQAVLVEEVNYASAPGSNGETYFPDVMRTMFPDQEGTDLMNPVQDQVDSLHFDYSISSIIDPYNLKLIVFIQDDNDKEVYMANVIPVEVINGIESIEEGMASVYPNPSSGSIHIENVQNASIYIYNSIGEIVYENRNADASVLVNLSDQANGLYFVKVISNENVQTLPVNILR